MLPGVDVGNKGAAMCRRIVERRWRDNPVRILKRGQDVKREPEFIRRMPLGNRHTYRSDKPGAIAISDQLVDFLSGRPLRLRFGKLRAARGKTGQRRAVF